MKRRDLRYSATTVLLPTLLLAGAITGCGPTQDSTLDNPTPTPTYTFTPSPVPAKPSPSPTPAPGTPASLQLPTAKCHLRVGGGNYLDGWLPDPHCTPGVTNPSVTQANISSTICKSGWTATVRPTESYTAKLKVQGISDYGYRNTSTTGYEEDHYIPLELGGSPTDPGNLWPEPSVHYHNSKDGIENQLREEVCSGYMPLALAQEAIQHNWTMLPPPNGK